MEPVIGRDCGECTVCCVATTIDQPDIQKESGARCRHCAGGCAIHLTRPQVCRNFECGWRQLGMFGAEWRPDRSGVLIELDLRPAEGGAAVAAFWLTLVADPLRTVRQPGFADFVAGAVGRDLPLYLVLPGRRGHRAANCLLNTAQMKIAVTEPDRVQALIEGALDELLAHEFRVHVMQHAGNDVSA